MAKNLPSFASVMQKIHYWADLFKKEQAATPSKKIASKLIIFYVNILALLKEAKKLATDEEMLKVQEIEVLIPSYESLLAFFVCVEKGSSLSSRELGRFSVETRMELLSWRNSDKFKEKKQEFQDRLENIIVLLKPFM